MATLVALLGFGQCSRPHHDGQGRVIQIEAAADFEFQLRKAFMTARAGDRIVLPPGTLPITDQLSLDVSYVTVEGRAMYEIVLNFGGVDTGAEGILVTADAFTMIGIELSMDLCCYIAPDFSLHD